MATSAKSGQSSPQVTCGGCEKPASALQCPLCEAEGNTVAGFYCSQECFVKEWRSHRDAQHPSGVARKKSTMELEMARVAADEKALKLSKKAKKRAREAQGEEGASAPSTREAVADPPGDAPNIDAEETSVSEHVAPWMPLPTPAQCKERGVATVKPALLASCPRAVVASATADLETSFWPAVIAATQFVRDNVQGESSTSADNAPKVLIITGNAVSAHAVAWGLRFAGLAARFKLVLDISDEAMKVDPSTHFTTEIPIVITTSALLDHQGRKKAGSTSLWLTGSNCTLVTLPDVSFPEDYQALTCRAIFFVLHMDAQAKLPTAKVVDNGFVADDVTHRVGGLDPASEASGSFRWNPILGDVMGTRFDNDVSSCLARGDLVGSLQHVIRLFGGSARARAEEVLRNGLLADWGSASVVVAHHKLAYVLRYLFDRADKFTVTATKKNLGVKNPSLKDLALRAVARVVSFLPPISDDAMNATEAEERRVALGLKPRTSATASELDQQFNYYSSLPNLQLQATLCYVFGDTFHGFIDKLAAAWGVKKVIEGPQKLAAISERSRREAYERVLKRFSAKLDSKQGAYYALLMHFVCDAVGSYSLPIEEVRRRTAWSIVSEREAGSLEAYLADCMLLAPSASGAVAPGSAPSKSDAIPTTLSSRKTARGSGMNSSPLQASYLSFPVKCLPPSASGHSEKKARVETARSSVKYLSLPYSTLPLTGRRQRDNEVYRKLAVEEILMAMPRKPVPMYIGDVGNLIGSWFRFNARYNGSLGVTLGEFLLQNPEEFRVVSNVVTRRKAGVSEQVPIRFDDNDDLHDDNDDDSDREARQRKDRDRRLLTGKREKGSGKKVDGTLHHSAKARKRAIVSAFNKERFNKNHKKFDSSAKVPGYVKRGPRKLKGRGKKANKRNTKRGA